MSKTFPYAYIRKKICRVEEAVIPIQAKVVQYGLGFFGGIRGHYNKKQKKLHLFRLKDHYDRLAESAKIMHMKMPISSYKKFEELIFELIKKNKITEDIYMRPCIYAGTTKLSPHFIDCEEDLAIYFISLKNYFKSDGGLNVCISSWRRFEDDVLSAKAKMTAAYANSALAKTEAMMNGFDEAIFLNRDGNVCEATGANIFGIKNGVVYTPPLHANNLNGITRRTVIELFKNQMGLVVKEEEFDRSQTYTFDELFFTGTAAKVSWIQKVDHRKIGSGTEGKYTLKLKEQLEEITVGENTKYNHWLTSIG